MSHPYSGPGVFAGHENGAQAASNGIEWAVRPYREGDLTAITALINAAKRADTPDEAMAEDELRRNFEIPRFDPVRQAVVVEGPRMEGVPPGALVGYGRIAWSDDDAEKERIYSPRVYVHPAARGHGLERVIAGWLVQAARNIESNDGLRRMEKVTIDAGAREEVTYLISLWRELGLKEVRHYWTMARPLDERIDEPQPIEGVHIRPYKQPEDNSAALEAFNSSFADHFDFHPEHEEDWLHWVTGPTFRPELSWLAEIEEEPGKMAGFCLCVVLEGQNKLTGRREGWIDILGTVRGWRRVGLGRALLLHGLLSLRSAGLETALLGVDSQSPTGANRLYESVGFRIRSREVQFKGALDEVKV